MKKCNTCEVTKPIEEFSKHKVTRDGYRNSCKSCVSIKYKKQYKSKANQEERFCTVCGQSMGTALVRLRCDDCTKELSRIKAKEYYARKKK